MDFYENNFIFHKFIFAIFVINKIPNIMKNTYNLLIIDDFQISAYGTKAILQWYPEFTNIYVSFSLNDALEIMKEYHIDVVLCDIFMPEQDGFEALTQIKKLYPQTKIMFLSISEEKDILLKSFIYKVDGYQFKDASKDELYNSIITLLRNKRYFSSKIMDILFDDISRYAEIVMNGKSVRIPEKPKNDSISNKVNDLSKFSNIDLRALLTSREIEILKLVGMGMSTREIANKLNISTFTVSTHRKNINTKLDIESLREMKIIAQQL